MSSAQLLFEIGSFDISQPGHCQSRSEPPRHNLPLVQPTQHPPSLPRPAKFKKNRQHPPYISVFRLYTHSISPLAFPARPPILTSPADTARRRHTRDDEHTHTRAEDGLVRLPLVQTLNAATLLLSPAPGPPRVPVLPPQPSTAVASAQRSRRRHFHHPSHHPSPAPSPRNTPTLVAGHRQLDIGT